MSFKVVSLGTKNTDYENHLINLRASLNRQEIKYILTTPESTGSWYRNCKLKVAAILNALNSCSDDIVWIDADAIVEGPITIFNNIKEDIAVYILKDEPALRAFPNGQLCSGTIFFKNNETSRIIIDAWSKLLDRKQNDQELLHQALSTVKHTLLELPPEYCKIFDRKSQEGVEGLIVHYQASRKQRVIIGSSF